MKIILMLTVNLGTTEIDIDGSATDTVVEVERRADDKVIFADTAETSSASAAAAAAASNNT